MAGPPQRPDLNITECVWGHMKGQKVSSRPTFTEDLQLDPEELMLF